jgi:adenylosuccinate lyase
VLLSMLRRGRSRVGRSVARSERIGELYDICRDAVRQKRPLLELLLENKEIAGAMSRTELEVLCDPANYLGQAGTMVDRVLARTSS